MGLESGSSTAEAVNAELVFGAWLEKFFPALIERDPEALGQVLAPNAWWRDMVALDWRMSSHNGIDDIVEFVTASPEAVVEAEIDSEFGPLYTTPAPGVAWVEGYYRFSTKLLNGSVHVRLVQDSPDGEWLAWTVLTEGAELKDRPLAVRHHRRRPSGAATEEPWHQQRARKTAFERPDPDVLIVGGAQNGLGVAATLTLMGVDTLIVDRSARVGDVWRDRYESLVLHAPVYSDHLPHFPFPENWPVYSPARKFADWLEAYARAMELDVWNSTEVLSATQDDDGRWSVVCNGPQGERTVRPAHLIVATGTSSVPWEPSIPGRDQFRGTVIHSHEHQTGGGWDERKVIVIGAGTSAHDVAEDFCLGGAEVTMVQRGPTYILSRDKGNQILFESLYSEDSPRLDFADLQADSIPWPLLLELAVAQTEAIADLDRELLDGLEAAGFQLCMGDPVMGEKSGLMAYGCRPGGPGGYYINVGASELIVEGRIAVHSGAGLERFEPDGVVLSDGTRLEADLVVLATGYLDMRESSRAFLGDDIVDRTDPFYGIDPETKERGLIHQPSGVPNLWYAGGGVIEVRRYGKFLALQIAAALDGHVDGSGAKDSSRNSPSPAPVDA